MKRSNPPTAALTLGGGVALATLLGAVAVLRRDRPLHAFGDTHLATLDVAAPAGVGVPLLDTLGSTPCVVRTSRATSLSRTGPDIMGLALRVDGRDLLFASTGTSLLGRYVLRVHRQPANGPMTTLLPLDSPSGPLQLALEPQGAAWRLSWSRPSRGRWTPVGSLRVDGARQPDPGRFDPTGNPPEGLRPPGWVLGLRDPAYRLARALVPRPRG